MYPTPSPKCRNRGLTLVELVVTLMVGTALISIAASASREMTGRSRMSSAVNELLGHIHLARSEAVKRRQKVILCPSTDGSGCKPTIEWQEGYMVFVDSDQDGERDDGEPLLRLAKNRKQQKDGEMLILIRSSRTERGRKKITYFPEGISRGQTATFTFCDRQKHAIPMAIIISPTGRPRLSTTRSRGEPIVCPEA
ncbi:MAG: GspH/FimT family pseudopilin [Sedimenticola sp.]